MLSPLRVVEFDTGASLHHVLESSELIGFLSICISEVGFLSRSIFGVALLSKGRPGVVGLISIRSQSLVFGPTSFWQRPSGEVLFVWRFCASLGHVSSWTYWSGCWSLVLQSLTSSETKSELLWSMVDWFFFRIILRTWIMLEIATGEPWLSSDFWC